MSTEDENGNQEEKPVISLGVMKALAILFVLGIYAIIFMKIMFLK